MARQLSARGQKPKPGRIVFVGSGPGDPGLLTTRARTALTNAALVFIDPDVPEAVLTLVGTDLPPIAGPVPPDPKTAKADKTGTADDGAGAAADEAAATVPGGPDIRPALGEPAEIAKTLTAEARSGADVVRLVSGDPLSV